MQEAIPYRTHLHSPSVVSASGNGSPEHGGVNSICHKAAASDAKSVEKMVLENAVVVFGKRGCCMCHVVKTLLLGHGVNPTVFEVDEADEGTVAEELSRIHVEKREINNGIIQFPAVFVGGKLFGGLDQVIATHISGDLVPILKDAGALWL